MLDITYYNYDLIKSVQSNDQEFKKLIDSLTSSNNNSISKILKEAPPHENFNRLFSIAEYIKNTFNHLIIIGMGGAILNPMAITAFCEKQKEDSIKITYQYTIEPNKFQELEKDLDYNKTAFIVISKSGETIETLTLFTLWLEKYKNGNVKNLKDHFYFITGKNNNTLRKTAKELNCVIFNHDDINGRYSTFSNVGLLPAIIAGINVKDFCDGARSTLHTFLSDGIHSSAAIGGKFLANMHSQKKSISVIVSYIYKMQSLLQWQAQILAESSGKKGKGITPIIAMAPIDHHSQLQLYLDGPKDKFFTLIYDQNLNENDKEMQNNIDYILNYKSLDCTLKVVYQAAFQILKQYKLPIRTITLEKSSIKSIGSLMMYFMIETIVFSKLINVNPFNQPSVNHMKNLTSNLLESFDKYKSY